MSLGNYDLCLMRNFRSFNIFIFIDLPISPSKIENYFYQKYYKEEKPMISLNLIKVRIYDTFNPVDSELDNRVSKIIEENEVNYYEPELYKPIHEIYNIEKDHINMIMSFYDLFIMFCKSQKSDSDFLIDRSIELQAFTPMALYSAIKSNSPTSLFDNVMAFLLSSIIRDSSIKSDFLDLIMYNKMKFEDQANVWLHVMQV